MFRRITYLKEVMFSNHYVKGIPPTAVGGLVQIRPRLRTDAPVDQSGLSFIRRFSKNMLDLNHPPTAVGGISSAYQSDFCRLDLNDPSTTVGGLPAHES